MAIPEWPSSLPELPLHGGYTKDVQSSVVRDDGSKGFINVRRRFTAISKYHTINMALTESQLTTFKSFFESTLGQGSLAFSFRNPLDDGGTMRCRWSGGTYSLGYDEDTLDYYVSFNLEELPGTIYVFTFDEYKVTSDENIKTTSDNYTKITTRS